MTEAVELKPCPMCGGKAYYRNTVDFSSARCGSCHLETKLHDDQEGAFYSWNRRSDHPVEATAMITVVDSFTGRFGVAVNGQEVRYLYDGKPHAGPVNFTFKADADRAAFIAQQAVKMVIQAAQKEGE